MLVLVENFTFTTCIFDLLAHTTDLQQITEIWKQETGIVSAYIFLQSHTQESHKMKRVFC